MKRTLARLTTLAAALPLAAGLVAGSTAVHAQDIPVTLPGCWGAGGNSTIYCDITLTAKTPHPEIGLLYVRACAGDCYDIPVQWADPHTPDADLCVEYRDGAGNHHGACGSEYVNYSTDIFNVLRNIIVNLFPCGAATCVY